MTHLTLFQRRVRRAPRWAPVLAAVLLPVAAVPAQSPTATAVMKRMDATMSGKTNKGLVEMTVVAPTFTRTLVMRACSSGADKALVKILEPAKERGTVSLRIGDLMWYYLPRVERTLKIAPSMMLKEWMGSDFTNDDMMKASSYALDYTHRFLEKQPGDPAAGWRIECLPKPGLIVVWGKVIFVIGPDFLPLKQEFIDERGRLVKTLTFGEVRDFGGRSFPSVWTMENAREPGRRTRLVYREIAFDIPLPEDTFSLRSLSR